ncbi:hypothetical protein ATW7_10508 [Alteromonadales bacterium TW-7]|nr:hypothetical protein ATW7_10508 [Alteromonadales bacterium TW-7]
MECALVFKALNNNGSGMFFIYLFLLLKVWYQ